MPQITESTKIENGWVMGTVRTNSVGSDCEFEICPIDEWEELTEEEAGKLAVEAMWGSGQVDVWY